MMVLRGVALSGAYFLLIVMGIVDTQMIPQVIVDNLLFPAGVFAATAVVAGCFLTQIANPSALGLVGYALFIPVFAVFFFWLVEVVVCVFRFYDPTQPDKWRGEMATAIVQVTLTCGLNFGSLLIEIFVNGPICKGTSGILSGSSVSVLLFAFYRVFMQVYFSALKKSESRDGLKAQPKGLNDESTDEQYRALPVEFSDYSYGYTYSSEPDDL
jgi:hypothetical protein